MPDLPTSSLLTCILLFFLYVKSSFLNCHTLGQNVIILNPVFEDRKPDLIYISHSLSKFLLHVLALAKLLRDNH